MAEEGDSQDLLTPFEIIFSCSICQATVRNLYRNAPHEGLIDGRGNGRAPRLWLAECGHVSCGEHFEGGGPPFHPDNEVPRAPCPMCIVDDGHSSPRRLFCIMKDAHKSHDDAIPNEFFETPPIQLDNRGPPGMQALRFQYLQLARYGIMVSKKLEHVRLELDAESQQAKTLSQANQYLEQKTETMQKRIKELEAIDQESKIMRNRIKELEVIEKKYKAYKEREPEIKHYLNAFTAITKENGLLKEQLLTLGYEVPQTSYVMKPQNPREVHPTTRAGVDGATTAGGEQNDSTSAQHEKAQYVMTGSSRTLSRPAAATRHNYPEEQDSSSSGRKRGHREYVDDAFQQAVETTNRYHNDDEDLMPPPPKPVNRKVATPRLVAEPPRRRESDGRRMEPKLIPIVETFDNGRWRRSGNVALSRQTPDRRREKGPSQYMISGALRPVSRGLNGRVAEISINEAPIEVFPREDKLPPRRIVEERLQRDEPQDMPFLRPLQPQVRPVGATRQPNFYADDTRADYNPIQEEVAQRAAPLPVRATSRSSTFRLPPIPASRRQVMPPDFVQQAQPPYIRPQSRQFLRNNAYMTPHAPRTSNQYDPLPTMAVAVSPFFNRQAAAAPQYRGYDSNVPYGRAPPSRLGTAAMDFRMHHSGTSRAPNRSLNSLSFMQNAYTSANEPIFNSAVRKPTAYESRTFRPNAVMTNIRGAKTGGFDPGMYGGRPNTNAYAGNGYGSRYSAPSRGLFSAAGRRTVQR